MSGIVVTRLRELVSANGVEVVRDHRRCEALVRDFCGSDIRDCNLLLQGLREGIPGMLLEDIGRTPASQSVNRLVGKLTNNLGLTPEAARWVVLSWGFALGLIKQAVSPLPPVSQPKFSGTGPFPPENTVSQPSVVIQPAGMTQNSPLAVSPGKAGKKTHVASGGGVAGVGSGKTASVFLFVYRMLGGIVALGSLGLLIYSMSVDEKPNPDPVQVVVGMPGNARENNGTLARGFGSGTGGKVEGEAEKSNLAMNGANSEKGKDSSKKDSKLELGMEDASKGKNQSEKNEMGNKDSIGRNVNQRDWPKEITNSIGMKLVRIPKGKFLMGSPKNEKWHRADENQHEVLITRDYLIGETEVTQKQYKKVVGINPSYFQGDKLAKRHPQTGRVVKEVDSSNHPVEQVSWEDAVEFCMKLSALPEEKAAGRMYHLPTEAEWEYACRAGSKTAYILGESSKSLGDYAWFDGNSNKQTHPVGEKKANAWGLYDMHGNVHEWCSDWYGNYPKGAVSDPTGAREGSYRVNRGGSCDQDAAHCRSANRSGRNPSVRYFVGFRVALSLSGISK